MDWSSFSAFTKNSTSYFLLSLDLIKKLLQFLIVPKFNEHVSEKFEETFLISRNHDELCLVSLVNRVFELINSP